MKQILIPGVLALALSACAVPGQDTKTASANTDKAASAVMAAKSGSQVAGTLEMMTMGNGVHVMGTLTGLAPNQSFGFHVHEKGDCSAADASSAGGHFNPTAQPHGSTETAAHHAGDMDNIKSDDEGTARVSFHIENVGLANGSATDINGRALVVHAKPDDYTTQPSGNSGDRIACGVITLK